MEFKAIGNKIMNIDHNGESFDWALCDKPAQAIRLMERAHYLNDVKRQYTASARLFYRVEQLPGFKWLTPNS